MSEKKEEPLDQNSLAGHQSIPLIRPWTIQDLPHIQDITWQTWLATYSSFIPTEDLKSYFDEHYSVEALTELFNQEEVDGFVAELNNRLVGYEKNKFSSEETRYYVSSVYVLPECQGMGLGGRLLVLAERKALEYGLDRIWLGVMTQNTSALKWYRKKGFEFVEEFPFTMGRTTVPHLIGYKLIDTASH